MADIDSIKQRIDTVASILSTGEVDWWDEDSLGAADMNAYVAVSDDFREWLLRAPEDIRTLLAEVAILREEIEDLSGLSALQARLLTDVANALHGPPPRRTSWSHDDLPTLAADAVVKERRAANELARLNGRTLGMWRGFLVESDVAAVGAETDAEIERHRNSQAHLLADLTALADDLSNTRNLNVGHALDVWTVLSRIVSEQEGQFNQSHVNAYGYMDGRLHDFLNHEEVREVVAKARAADPKFAVLLGQIMGESEAASDG